MKRNIYKYNEFKLLLEREEEEELDFSNFGLDDQDTEDESTEDESNEEGEDTEENQDVEEDNFTEEDQDQVEEEEEEEKEESPRKLFEEDPAYYVNQAIEKVERKIVSLFEKPEKNEKGRVNSDPSSYYNQGVELVDVKTTDMPMSKTLIVKYHDNDFMYHLMINIDVTQGIPKEDEEVATTDMIEYCGVKFKKYDSSNNLLGELDRKEVKIGNIDQDFIDTLNGEMDEKYSIDSDFEIEYEDENK